MIEKNIGKRNTFTEDWKKVVFKTKIQIVKELALATHEFYKLRMKRNWFRQIFSPLYIAADQGKLQLCQYMIGRSIDVNWKDKIGQTPLLLAAKMGHFEITKLILGNVVEKNPPTDDGCTPLYVAASHGHLEIYR